MIRGPQSAGLLFGRKDLIEAAKFNHSPHEAPIGRPMKVNKEEIFGMYAALKAYLELDHEKEWQDWLDRIERIKTKITTIETVSGETHVSPGPANAFPSMLVSWDEEKVKMSPKEVSDALKAENPSIVTNIRRGRDGAADRLSVGVVLLKPEQVDYVAERLADVLIKAV